MKRRLPPLNPLMAFEAAARHLSFTRAADELGVTQGAISRQVKVLEAYLGITLFERENNGIRLTHGAEQYVRTATRALDSIHRATDQLMVTHNHTTLTIRSYSTLLAKWLVPRLTRFHAKYPQIEVRLLASPDTVNFERDFCDVAIVYEPKMEGLLGQHLFSDELSPDSPAADDLISHRLFSDELSPVCTRTFLEEWSVRTPADLDDVPVLMLHARSNDWPDWLELAGRADLKFSRPRFFDDFSMVIECALQGQGMAMGQLAYLQRELASGALVRPFEPTLHRPEGYCLVFPKERAGLEKVRLFTEWLLTQVQAPPPA